MAASRIVLAFWLAVCRRLLAPSASQSSRTRRSKARISAYEDLVEQATRIQPAEELDLRIPFGPRLGSKVVSLRGVSKAYDGKVLLELQGTEPGEFFCPGSILRVRVDPTQPLAHGLPEALPIWFQSSPAFETDAGVTVAGYTDENPLLVLLQNGWIYRRAYPNNPPAGISYRVRCGNLPYLG